MHSCAFCASEGKIDIFFILQSRFGAFPGLPSIDTYKSSWVLAWWLEYDRKPYGRPYGRYNGRNLRPQCYGKNSLFQSFGRKTSYGRKCRLMAETSSYGQNYGLAVQLK